SQFNAQGGDYPRHFLKRLVDSLGERAEDEAGTATGFEKLIAAWRLRVPTAARTLDTCSGENTSDEDRHRAIGEAAEGIGVVLGLDEADLGVVTALLYAAVDGFGLRTRQRARHYLSGEPLTESDRRYVSELPTHAGDVLFKPMMVSLTRAVASV